MEVKEGQTVVGKYEYDGQNRRVKKHFDSDSPSSPDGIDSYVHYFYNAGWQILETRETVTEAAEAETLQPKHQYVWSERYIDSAVLRDENTDQDSLCDDGRIYYLADANFSVTALVDSTGDALERYVYSPYGAVTIYDAAWSGTFGASSYANTTLYTGRELDLETGLYQYRNRYYCGELGRFVSRDPTGYEADDSDLYRYVGDRPLSLHDPSGLQAAAPALPWWGWWGGGAASGTTAGGAASGTTAGGISATVCTPAVAVTGGVVLGCTLYKCVTYKLEPCMTEFFISFCCGRFLG